MSHFYEFQAHSLTYILKQEIGKMERNTKTRWIAWMVNLVISKVLQVETLTRALVLRSVKGQSPIEDYNVYRMLNCSGNT